MRIVGGGEEGADGVDSSFAGLWLKSLPDLLNHSPFPFSVLQY